jgi:hypothetical protein
MPQGFATDDAFLILAKEIFRPAREDEEKCAEERERERLEGGNFQL